jgi:hypothetical protein
MITSSAGCTTYKSKLEYEKGRQNARLQKNLIFFVPHANTGTLYLCCLFVEAVVADFWRSREPQRDGARSFVRVPTDPATVSKLMFSVKLY